MYYSCRYSNFPYSFNYAHAYIVFNCTYIICIFQVNQITSFIDASNIYGSDISITKRLRLGRRGRLRVTKLGKEELLPLAPEECADFAKRHYCFAAGDYYLYF